MIIKDKIVKRNRIHKEKLQEENKNLKILKQIMDDYLKGKELTIKTVVIKEFSNALMEIIEENEVKKVN